MYCDCNHDHYEVNVELKIVASGARKIVTFLYDDYIINFMIDIRCDAETTSTETGITYSWPTSPAGETVIFTCPTSPNVLVTRNCSSEGLWQTVVDDGCDTVNVTALLLGLTDSCSFANVRLIY